MKTSRWIYTICALALFSAHQTHRNDADKPDYSRSPAMIRPNKAGKSEVKKQARTQKQKAQSFTK